MGVPRGAEDSDGRYVRSPYYGKLKQILEDAGVELVPTDRDLAPAVREHDADDEDVEE